MTARWTPPCLLRTTQPTLVRLSYACLLACFGFSCRVVVRRYDGALDAPLSVAYATKDGTAVAGVDYEAVQVGRWMMSARLVHIHACWGTDDQYLDMNLSTRYGETFLPI